MHIQFAVLLLNKTEESLDIIKVLILLRLLLSFMWLQILARVWHFLLDCFINVLYKSQSFVFLQDKFQAIFHFW